MTASFVDSADTGSDVLATSRSVGVPGGVNDSDVAVCVLARWHESADFPAVTAPSGAVLRGTVAAGSIQSLVYLVRIDGHSTLNFSWAGSRWSTLHVQFFTGVDTGLDLSVVPFDSGSGSGTSIGTRTVTTVDGAALGWHVNTQDYGSTTTHTPPTNFTETSDVDPMSSAYRISPGDGNQSASGATISVSQDWVAALVALAPAEEGGVTGSLAETQDNQTLAASGQLGYSGSLAKTQDDQTLAAAGQLGHSGSLAETQENQTLAASGTVGEAVTGSLAETQDDQTLAAAGQLGYSGSLAQTQDDQTLTAAGQLGHGGSVAETQDNQTLAASGDVTPPGAVSGSLAETQDDQILAASGQLGYGGSVAGTQDDQTLAASGTVAAGADGSLAEIQDDQILVASGTVVATAVASPGWWGLKAILDQRRAEFIQSQIDDEQRCPYDGELLRISVSGVPFCPFDGPIRDKVLEQ